VGNKKTAKDHAGGNLYRKVKGHRIPKGKGKGRKTKEESEGHHPREKMSLKKKHTGKQPETMGAPSAYACHFGNMTTKGGKKEVRVLGTFP